MNSNNVYQNSKNQKVLGLLRNCNSSEKNGLGFAKENFGCWGGGFPVLGSTSVHVHGDVIPHSSIMCGEKWNGRVFE